MYKYLLSLGSNKGDRPSNLLQAVKLLKEAGLQSVGISSLIETEPWGTDIGQSFYNICLIADYQNDPHDLLKLSNKIESKLGRERDIKYAPRTIDIDILFANDLVLNTVNLRLPHPELENRRFVLYPASQIAPEWIHPVSGKSVSQLLEECTDNCWVKPIETLL